MKIESTAVFHVPVLLNEVISSLNVIEGHWYIDATAGGGGHTEAIAVKGGRVLALDQDKEAIKYLQNRFQTEVKQRSVIISEGNFGELTRYVQEAQLLRISGILFDLGMSTYQIKQSGRGFSFRAREPLDMRMSKSQKMTAAHVINTYSQEKLYEIFRTFGEDNLARPIAIAISRARRVSPIRFTDELVDIVDKVYQKANRREKIHPGTRIFQAIRIEVNQELKVLKEALPQALEILSSRGRLVVISFHSLEDRIVKQFFRKAEETGQAVIISQKPVRAISEEIKINPASRSAKLRVLEKN